MEAIGELTGSESLDASIETPWETFEEQVAVALAAPVSARSRVANALVKDTAVTLVYDEALDEDSVLGKGSFFVSLGGSTRTPTGVSISGRTVTLTLATDEAANAGVTAFLTYGEVAAEANFARYLGL